MTDDCQNNWGRSLNHLEKSSRISTSSKQTNMQAELRDKIYSYTNGIMTMAKICATGTDATWSATEMCAVGKIGRTAIAVGSYAAGNNSPRQELTTITLNAGEVLGRIMDPLDEKCNKVRNMSVVFPYHLHESMEDHNWEKNACEIWKKRLLCTNP